MFSKRILNISSRESRHSSCALNEISSEVFPLGPAEKTAKKINLAGRLSFNDIGKFSLQRETSQMSLAHDRGNDLYNAHGMPLERPALLLRAVAECLHTLQTVVSNWSLVHDS